MTNIEKYNSAFIKTFSANEIELGQGFQAGLVKNWDSIRHLSLITVLEDEFDIMFDSEDLLGLRSYEIGKQILSKYGVEV